MEKKLIGKKGNNRGYVFAPYIHLHTIVFPGIKLIGYTKKGEPKFIKT